MKKLPIALAIGTLFASTSVFAADFSTVDANSDGFVTLAEAAVGAPEITEDAFKSADANGDGVLSQEEFTTATAQ
ncbi:MAG: hypothetical protein AAGL24_05930 [Pseudomonadota bacterium]